MNPKMPKRIIQLDSGRTAARLWGRNGVELWRTGTEYDVPKFHVFHNGDEIISTFAAGEAIAIVKGIRREEDW